MKKFLVVLLFFSLAEAQTSEMEIVNNLQEEIVTDNFTSAEDFLRILDKYFNDGCRIAVNNEEIILKKERFSQYANVAAAFFSKINKNFELKISKNVQKIDDEKTELSAFLHISKKQKAKINLVVEKEKCSEIICKDVHISKSQHLILRGVFNLLK